MSADGATPGPGRLRRAERWDRLAAVVTGRMASGVGVAIWIAVVVITLPVASKVGSVESSRLTEFFPSNAQSTQALQLDGKFPSGRALQAEVVYYRSSGLTKADLSRARTRTQSLVARYPTTFGAPSSVVRAPDGKVAVVIVPIPGNQDAITAGVRTMRRFLGDGSGGLEVRVTGQAAIQTDLLNAFSGADILLLGATAILVAVLLAATYRSPVMWLVPLVCVGIAESVAQALVYALARGGLTVNSQSAALVTVIVFGAGTDYALLITARYREELRRQADHRRAMVTAWRHAAPAIAASACTVAGALACLLPAELNLTTDFGIVGMIGVLSAAVVVLAAYPAFLLVMGRGVFWPSVPRHAPGFVQRGPWAWLSRIVSRGHRPLWISGFVLLGGAAAGLFSVNTNVSALSELPPAAPSAQGYALLEGNFPPGEVSPVDVVVTDAHDLGAVRGALSQLDVTAGLSPAEHADGMARFDLILSVRPTGTTGFRAVKEIRTAVARVAPGHVLVGGPTAQDLDVSNASHHDTLVIVPCVLAVVLFVLWLLLRALLGPILVVLTVIVTYLAALGITSLFVVPLLHLPGIDPTVPLLTFVFLIALGVDYNIFLLTRIREEVLRLGSEQGVAAGVATTGVVLTSAGIVLAGTFSVLALLPVVASREIGIVVAIGVLADTFLVRTVLVPTLVADMGARFWWPTKLPIPLPEGERAQ